MYISRILCRPMGRNDIDVISVGVVVLNNDNSKCDFLISGNKLRILQNFLSDKDLSTFESFLDNLKSSKSLTLERLTKLNKKQKGLLGLSKPKYFSTEHISLSDSDISRDLYKKWVDYNKNFSNKVSKDYSKYGDIIGDDFLKSPFKVMTSNFRDWDFDEYHATYKPNGLRYWTSDGLFTFEEITKKKIRLGIINKIKLYYWLKNARELKKQYKL